MNRDELDTPPTDVGDTGGGPVQVGPFDGTREEWDAFVRGTAGWTHFHLYGWRRVLEDVLRHDCLYMAARDPVGELRGVLPMTRVKSPIFGHFLVSLPFVNYGGPLGDDEAVRALTEEAVGRARTEGADLLELRSRRDLGLDLPVSHRKITVLLDLPGDPDELWDGLKSKVRSQVRRPRKEGVEVRFGPDQVEPFHDVFARHMHTLGTPAHGLDLFRALAREFEEDMWVGCAYLDGAPVACGAGFRWGDEFEITWASDLVEYRRI
ncbi:MAG TPA: GNAT family N-acetyltransferase, partial [Gemmatimonadota bacterium]|nr:GNAT family N-acetyltransferase [Gemmatimonadota bacterium]